MRIPGHKRSQEPDDIGNRAGIFAEAIRDGNMNLAWDMLSKETRGMRMGVWATRNNVDMQNAYRAAYDLDHDMRPSMMKDFRDTVLRLWPLEDLTDLGVAPTNFVDDVHAFAFLPFGVIDDESTVSHRRMMSGLVIPMIFEEGEWQVDLPGWRFMDS